MTHSSILLKDLSLSFTHKTCFEGFNFQIHPGSKIAIIGKNGCGKSTLLKCLNGIQLPTSGNIYLSHNTSVGYVPQIIEDFTTLSGGQRFNKALTTVLLSSPDLLLLDEPTNHLDTENRLSLFKLLKHYTGTLIVASHDIEFLNECFDILWHLDDGKIDVFIGKYANYQQKLIEKCSYLEKEIHLLQEKKVKLHQALMKEQTRSRKSREKGEKNIGNRKWPTVVCKAKANRAVISSGNNKLKIEQKKEACLDSLRNLNLHKVIKPRFSLSTNQIKNCTLVTVQGGSVGYHKSPLMSGITFTLSARERIALVGKNGCGKTTLVKAILNDKTIIKTGNWILPKPEEIGFLDQHYANLIADKSVFQTIAELAFHWTEKEVRRLLADFLFRDNEEVNALISTLSGGEKARLSLAQIAANTPKLLILDEVTNNLDLETKQHITEVLREYPGALIVISHDVDFLKEIHVDEILSLPSPK